MTRLRRSTLPGMALSLSRANSPLSDRSFLDPLFVLGALQDMGHENARRHDMVGINGARFDEVLDLGDGNPRGGRHDRIEVPGRPSIDEIADAVALPGVNEREV